MSPSSINPGSGDASGGGARTTMPRYQIEIEMESGLSEPAVEAMARDWFGPNVEINEVKEMEE